MVDRPAASDSPHGLVPTAQQLRCFEIALDIADEIIDFAGHGIIWYPPEPTVEAVKVWHVESGLYRPAEKEWTIPIETLLDQYRRGGLYFGRLRQGEAVRLQQGTIDQEVEAAIVVRDGASRLLIPLRIGERLAAVFSLWHQSTKHFTERDERLGGCLGKVISDAVADGDEVGDLLRLKIQMFDRRLLLLGGMSLGRLAEDYSRRAVELLHPGASQDGEAFRASVRTCDRVAKTLLCAGSHESVSQKPWELDRCGQPIKLRSNRMSARAFRSSEAVLVADLRGEAKPYRPTFADTSSLIAVPVEPVRVTQPIGVLTISRNQGHYTGHHASLLQLLAAHLSGPLKAALSREALLDTSTAMQAEEQGNAICTATMDALKQLGYGQIRRYVKRPDEKVLDLVEWYPLTDKIRAEDVSFNEKEHPGPFLVFEEQQPIVCRYRQENSMVRQEGPMRTMDSTDLFRARLHKSGVEEWIDLPLLAGGTQLGKISVNWRTRRSEGEPFPKCTPEDYETLTVLSRLTAQALQRVYAETRRGWLEEMWSSLLSYYTTPAHNLRYLWQEWREAAGDEKERRRLEALMDGQMAILGLRIEAAADADRSLHEHGAFSSNLVDLRALAVGAARRAIARYSQFGPIAGAGGRPPGPESALPEPVIRVERPEDKKPVNVRADRHFLQKNLDAVVDNAVLHGLATHITIRARRAAGYAVIEVEDNGIGINPDDQMRVFQPYTTNPGWDDAKGTSLSLFVARQTTEAQHGTLTVQSKSGGPTRFTFTFPIHFGEELGDESAGH